MGNMFRRYGTGCGQKSPRSIDQSRKYATCYNISVQEPKNLDPCLGTLSVETPLSQNAYHAKQDTDKNEKEISEYLTPKECNSEYCHKENFHEQNLSWKRKQDNKDSRECQSGLKEHFDNAISKVRTLSDGMDFNLEGVIDDSLTKQIEGLVVLFYGIISAENIHSVTAMLLSYVRSHFEGSMLKTLTDIVRDTLVVDVEAQIIEPQMDRPNWLKQVGDLKEGWTLFKQNNAFKRIVKLLNALVSAGLCKASDLSFSIKGFAIFNEEMFEKHMDAIDIVDAVIGTCTFFVEGAYMCFATGSIKPLLMNDCDAATLDNEYNEIIQQWKLVQNGNLDLHLGVSEESFSEQLDYVTKKFKAMTHSLSGFDKKLINDRIQTLLSIYNDYTTLLMSGGVRTSPFTIGFFGESMQGKTTIGDKCIDALLTSMGLSLDRKYRSIIKPDDKYWNTWRSDTLVGMMDDVGNIKASKAECSPIETLLLLNNNQVSYAPKAELEAKGKSLVQPKLALINGHYKHLGAKDWTVCPYSGQRRVDFSMDVYAREELQATDSNGNSIGLDSDKVRQAYTDEEGIYTPPTIEDLWHVTVYKAVKPNNMALEAKYEVVYWHGQYLKNITLSKLIEFLCEMNAKHQFNQNIAVDNARNSKSNFKMCPNQMVLNGKEVPCCHIEGNCPYHTKDGEPNINLGPMPAINTQIRLVQEKTIPKRLVPKRPMVIPKRPVEKQWGLKLASTSIYVMSRIKRRFLRTEEQFFGGLEQRATDALIDLVDRIPSSIDPIPFLPTVAVESKWAQNTLIWYYQKDIQHKMTQKKIAVSGLILLLCIFLIAVFNWFSIALLPVIWQFYSNQINSLRESIENQYISELRKRHDLAGPVVKRYRDKVTKECCKMFLGLAALYAALKVFRVMRKICNSETQGNINPTCDKDITNRDSEENVWVQVEKRPLPVCHDHKTITFKQLKEKVSKNLYYGEAHLPDGNYMVNSLALKSNIMLVPDHYFADNEEFRITFNRVNKEISGGQFTTVLSKITSIRISGSDLRICYTPNGGSFEDITKYLPTNYEFNSSLFEMVYKKEDGIPMWANGRYAPGRFSNGYCESRGVEYDNLSIPTFRGLCGAVIIADTRFPYIAGFHVGGETGKPRGNAVSLSLPDYEEALARLKLVPGVLITGGASTFRTQQMGVNVITKAPLSDRSPLCYLDEGKNAITYYGSTQGGATYHSDVKKSKISDTVHKICGIENIWGPPKFYPAWYGWRKALNAINTPADPMPTKLITRAVLDYEAPLLEKIHTSKIWTKCRPLSDIENMNGIPGLKFMDAIKLDTSMGLFFGGTKRDHIVTGEPTEVYPSGVRMFTPEVMEEINLVEDLYAKGMRGNCVSKACKKDEVLVVSKGKCRIFYANSVVLTFLLRKYFLHPIRFICMNSIIAECAVGVNCHSDEWQQLMDHMRKFGDDRVFAGDYGNYDQRLPSQVILGAIRVTIDIARVMGYDTRSLNIMEAMAGDLVYPFIAYNGDLISLDQGTHISGNSLTVIINSIAGSLNLRTFFYHVYPEYNNFRKYAAMMTYGDDNDGTISKLAPRFNVKAYSEWIGKYGQTYTHPDKESVIPEYMKAGDVDFLKRKSVYHPKLGVNLGALEPKSMWKSLHAYTYTSKSPSENELCVGAIDGFLREAFNHGKDKYEFLREQMFEVAEEHKYTANCTMLSKSYEELVDEWKEKYRPGSSGC